MADAILPNGIKPSRVGNLCGHKDCISPIHGIRSFEDAIRQVLVYGDNSDTMGGMAEVYYGVDTILWNEAENILP